MANASDLLRQALRHHQAGELPQAERLYREVLARDPDNADALHWLGIIAHQSNRPEVAADLIGRAVQRSPKVASYHHNHAEALVAAGQVDRAIEAYRRAMALDPRRPQTRASLGIALRRKGLEAEAAAELREAVDQGEHHPEIVRQLVQSLSATGHHGGAVTAARADVARRPEAADAHFALGEALGLAGDFDAAAAAFRQAVQFKPGDPRAHHGLGVALGRLGQLEEAIASLSNAARLRPDYPEAHRALGAIYLRTDQLVEAIEHYEVALLTRPKDVDVRRELAGALERNGQLAEAAEQYRQILKARPDAAEEIAFHLAAIGSGGAGGGVGGVAPSTPPAAYVAQYFDGYAETFDHHLVDKLEYRAPQLVHDAVAAALPSPTDHRFEIIDLGCGTGLCAPLFKPMAASIVGIDLSAQMLAKARERGLYDELVQGDLVEALRIRPSRFDLAIAADVLVYFGDLAPVLTAVAIALRPGGRFAFTVEADADAPATYRLRPTRRYIHGSAYLQAAATQAGLTLRSLEPAVLRTEKAEPVNGYVVLVERGRS